MKYRTFRNLVTLGAGSTLAALVATCYQFGGGSQTAHTRPVTTEAPVTSGTTTRAVDTQTQYPVSTAPAASQPQSAQRREDQLILNFLTTRAATTAKVQDAFPGEGFKVNFYRDEGSATWTRIKIDSDRDGKDDEKWDLQDGQPNKRRVATRDDEQYDREYRWRNSQWVEKR
jgi:hypothetical protein